MTDQVTDDPRDGVKKPVTCELEGQAVADLEVLRHFLSAEWAKAPEPTVEVTNAHVIATALNIMRAQLPEQVEQTEAGKLAGVKPAGEA